jgi:hypothetical protein
VGSFPLVRLFGAEMPGFAYLKTHPKPPTMLNPHETAAMGAWMNTKRFWNAEELTQGTWWFLSESGEKFLAQLGAGPTETRENGYVTHLGGQLRYDDFVAERMVYKPGKWALPEEEMFARPALELWLYVDHQVVVCVAGAEGNEHSAIAFDATVDAHTEPASCTYVRVVHLPI